MYLLTVEGGKLTIHVDRPQHPVSDDGEVINIQEAEMRQQSGATVCPLCFPDGLAAG